MWLSLFLGTSLMCLNAIPNLPAVSMPKLELFATNSRASVDNLDTMLTINGQTIAPFCRYRGGDANAVNLAAWGYGETLTLQAGTAPTYNDGSPLNGTSDDSVKFNAGGYYQAANNTACDIDSEDFVLEVVFKMRESSGAIRLLGKFDTTLGGYYLSMAASSYALRLIVYDGTAAAASISTSALSVNTWYHVLFFVDRSGSGAPYVNGLASGSATSVAAHGSISKATAFKFGTALTSAPYDSNIAYFAAWKATSWLDTHAQATVAKERFYKMVNIYPKIAQGTAIAAVATRNSIARTEKIESSKIRLYMVGAYWPRYAERKDASATSVWGYLTEPAGENEFLYSEDLTQAGSWTLVRTAISSNAIAAPNKIVTADGIIPSADNDTHGLTQAIATATTVHVSSVFARPGDKNWLYVTSSGVANANAYYDVSNGVVGTVGAAASAYIVGPYYNDFYRCILIYTSDGGANTHGFYVAEADGDYSFTGDAATVGLYLWGAQFEDNTGGLESSYIGTTTAAGARVADVLTFTMSDGNLGDINKKSQTLAVKYLIADRNNTTSMDILRLRDTSTATDKMDLMINTSDAMIVDYEAVDQANETAAIGSEVTNGYLTTANVRFKNGVLIGSIVKNNTDITLTTINSKNIPDDWDTLYIGHVGTIGLIGTVKIYQCMNSKLP